MADPESIKKHAFFQEVDWEKLEEGKDMESSIVSPFVPPQRKLFTIDTLFQELNEIVEKEFDFGDEECPFSGSPTTNANTNGSAFEDLTFSDRTFGGRTFNIPTEPTNSANGNKLEDPTFGDATFSDRTFGGRTFVETKNTSRSKCEQLVTEADNEIVLHEYVPVELLQRQVEDLSSTTPFTVNLPITTSTTSMQVKVSPRFVPAQDTTVQMTHSSPTLAAKADPASPVASTRQRARTTAKGSVQMQAAKEEREWEGKLIEAVESATLGKGRLKGLSLGEFDRFSKRGTGTRGRPEASGRVALNELFEPGLVAEAEMAFEQFQKGDCQTDSNSFTTSDSESSSFDEEFSQGHYL